MTSEIPAEAAPVPREPAARAAFRWVVLGGLLLMLGANLPGHMSVDSVIQLFEGRFGVHVSFNPPVMSWLLGRFDRLVPGTGLYVAACAGLFGAALLALPSLRPRTSWLGPLAAALVLLTPDFVVYQAIVWKDVLFANLSIAGFVCLARAATDWNRPGRRATWLAFALLLLATAGLVRQNGGLAQLMAAVALGWTARHGGWRHALGWGAGGLVAMLLAGQAIGFAVAPHGATAAADTGRGMRVLQHYDIVGVVAHDPSIRLDVIEKAAPLSAQAIREVGVKLYTPERVDTFGADPDFGVKLWRMPDEVVAAQWRALILEHPGAYLRHRLDVYRWLAAPPKLDRCLPFYVGVDGPADKMESLALPHGWEPQDTAVATYVNRFLSTPLFSHVAYGVLAVVVGAALLTRRSPADMVMLALMLSGLAFTASFIVISIACDYRYLYFLDLAAMTGLIYLALDPPWPRRLRRPAPG